MKWLMGYIKGHTAVTHGILLALLALGGASQLPFGQALVHRLIENHPRIEPIITVLVAIGFLLLNPSVQTGIKSATGIDLAVDEAKLQQSKEKIQEVQTDLAQAHAQAAQVTGQPKSTATPSSVPPPTGASAPAPDKK